MPSLRALIYNMPIIQLGNLWKRSKCPQQSLTERSKGQGNLWRGGRSGRCQWSSIPPRVRRWSLTYGIGILGAEEFNLSGCEPASQVLFFYSSFAWLCFIGRSELYPSNVSTLFWLLSFLARGEANRTLYRVSPDFRRTSCLNLLFVSCFFPCLAVQSQVSASVHTSSLPFARALLVGPLRLRLNHHVMNKLRQASRYMLWSVKSQEGVKIKKRKIERALRMVIHHRTSYIPRPFLLCLEVVRFQNPAWLLALGLRNDFLVGQGISHLD